MMNKKICNKKILIIYDSVQFFTPHFIKKGFLIYPTLRKVSLVGKVLRKICFKLNLSTNIWYGAWKAELGEINTVIIFASNEPLPLKYIKLHYPKINIIFWYWNPIFKSISPKEVPSKYCEKWSFDKIDCVKYAMKYNTTFYFNTIKLPKALIVHDVVFVGVDKGRRKPLRELEQNFKTQGLEPYIYIVDDDSNKRNYKGSFPAITYQKYLSLVSESRAILDYVQQGQHGLTLRSMEAIFFKKKLISNDLSLKNEDFYHPSNIFIMGEDDIENLIFFLNTSYVPIDDDIIKQYDVAQWIKCFK